MMSCSRMSHRVVLDADWFIINKTRYFKRIAYCAPTLGLIGEFTFSLPPGSAVYHNELSLQARFSHGLDWRESGQFCHDDVDKAIALILNRFKTPNVEFYAKGSEKCKLLERHLPKIYDLDDAGCPKYEEITKLSKSTLQKAIVFSQWLEWYE